MLLWQLAEIKEVQRFEYLILFQVIKLVFVIFINTVTNSDKFTAVLT